MDGLFNCRSCSGGWFNAEPKADKTKKKKTAVVPAKRTEAEIKETVDEWMEYVHPRAGEFFCPNIDNNTTDNQADNQEKKEKLDLQIRKTLTELASNIGRDSDPLLKEGCCLWLGESTKEKQNKPPCAVMRVNRVGDSSTTVVTGINSHNTGGRICFVNRTLAFCFGDDESFEDLMKLPKNCFPMSCGNQLCISMQHIGLPEETAEGQGGGGA